MPIPLPAAELERDLRRELRGEVRFDAGSRALYSTDASNYRQLPIGVVVPADVDDLVAAVSVCRRHGAPIVNRGGGTSLAGQCCNVAVVLDASKNLRRIVEIDPLVRRARVEPGVILDSLRVAAAPHGLTFGPDPATHGQCTLGGMIGNNSCGVRSVAFGKTVDNIEELEVLTYDGARFNVGATAEEEIEAIVRARRQGDRRGEIYAALRALRDRSAQLIRARFPDLPRRVSGFNLDQLLPENGFHLARALVGTEGTCVTVLGAVCRLVTSPPARTLVVLGFEDVVAAGRWVPEVLAHRPLGLEGIDRRILAAVTRSRPEAGTADLWPPGGAWLLVELGGEDAGEAEARARELVRDLAAGPEPPEARLVTDPVAARRVWALREAALGATARVPGERPTWPGWEDAAVPPARVGDYLAEFTALLARHGLSAYVYGHFGDGCIHAKIDFELTTRDGIAGYRAFVEEAADLVVAHGGSLSGEHGDGQARGELLERMFGPELVAAFAEFKAIWDPEGKMNPGKVVAPRRLDEDLRLGAGFRPARPATRFAFAADGGSLGEAALRCVGVGACRRLAGGTMCPSYRATGEERHSTRGRARLLHEMLTGKAITGGWRSQEVKEALDLCLACKGCKRDCPAGVDVAAYKAEFLSHYYEGRLRPRSAYAFGLVPIWSRLATALPGAAGVINAAVRAPGVGALVKWATGMAPGRAVPRLTGGTFRRWFRRRPRGGPERPRVVLWPDTFTDRFVPERGRAAVEVLGEAGFEVVIPALPLCCGRPLFDYGMLDRARSWLRATLEGLSSEIAAGLPVVVLEPSCLAVFRDELGELFPGDQAARRLAAQSRSLAEFLVETRRDVSDRPRLSGRALLHLHCHQKALAGTGSSADEEVLRHLGLDVDHPDTGCCGMAGAFGFERGERHRVSVAVGEQVLLPAVRAATPDTLLVCDGFSCREQILQATGRRALHLAEVLARATE